MAVTGASLAWLDRGAHAGAGSGGGGDRAPGRRSPLGLDPHAGAGRDAAGTAAFLAGLSARGKVQAAARDPRRHAISAGAEFGWLAVAPLRILLRRGAGVSGADLEPDL